MGPGFLGEFGQRAAWEQSGAPGRKCHQILFYVPRVWALLLMCGWGSQQRGREGQRHSRTQPHLAPLHHWWLIWDQMGRPRFILTSLGSFRTGAMLRFRSVEMFPLAACSEALQPTLPLSLSHPPSSSLSHPPALPPTLSSLSWGLGFQKQT